MSETQSMASFRHSDVLADGPRNRRVGGRGAAPPSTRRPETIATTCRDTGAGEVRIDAEAVSSIHRRTHRTSASIVTVTVLRCTWCGERFEWNPAPGRRPKYCRRSHRQRHFEARRQADELGISGVLISDDDWGRLRDAAYVLESAVADARADMAAIQTAAELRDILEALIEAAHVSLPEPIATGT